MITDYRDLPGFAIGMGIVMLIAFGLALYLIAHIPRNECDGTHQVKFERCLE